MGAPSATRRFLTAREAAEALDCHVETVRRAARVGALEPIRLRPGSPYKFRARDIEALVAGGRARADELDWR